MKLKTTTKLFIVYCIVPWLQRALSLVFQAAGRSSRVLDDWAWFTAQGLNHGPCLDGRNVAWTKSEGE